MNTIISKLRGDAGDREIYEQAGQIIKSGGLVAFPTETVYGLGGDALKGSSSSKIYAAKGRPSDNPLIVHIDRMDRLELLSDEIPELAYELGERFWPGPLTVILKKSSAVPYETTGGLDTVAVRMPSHEGARAFIEAAGGYIAAPSANLSGRPSPTRAAHVIEDLDGRIDMIIDGGDVDYGLESTIIDLTEDVPMILRPGFVTLAQLREVAVGVRMDPALPVAAGNIVPDGASGAAGGEGGAQPPDGAFESGREEALGDGFAGGSGEAKVPGSGFVTGSDGNGASGDDFTGGNSEEITGGLHPKAPGMKYRHYAPRGELIIVRGKPEAVAARINSLAESDIGRGESAGVIATGENLELYHVGNIKCAGARNKEETIARNLFSILREFDKEGVMHIYSEELDTQTLGSAIMNRLIKAAGGRIIEV